MSSRDREDALLRSLGIAGEWLRGREAGRGIRQNAEVARFNRALDLMQLGMHGRHLRFQQDMFRRDIGVLQRDESAAIAMEGILEQEAVVAGMRQEYAEWLTGSRQRRLFQVRTREQDVAEARTRAAEARVNQEERVLTARTAGLGVEREAQAEVEARSLAVVGARNASAAGRRFARGFAAELGQAGLAVVSGLARGIDAAAHEGALETGTAAVLAGGVDVVYPRENAGLYDEVAGRGALLSEQPPGTVPTARYFPPRNRIVSGLSLGVVVVEAAIRSGSLITARTALDQGREVFAVPGSPLDPRARGANDLIRNGAVLTETPADVLETIAGPFGAAWSESGPPAQDEALAEPPEPSDGEVESGRDRVAGSIGAAPVTVDELVRECQLSAAVVATVLLELELAGRIERHPGQRVSRVAQAVSERT